MYIFIHIYIYIYIYKSGPNKGETYGLHKSTWRQGACTHNCNAVADPGRFDVCSGLHQGDRSCVTTRTMKIPYI